MKKNNNPLSSITDIINKSKISTEQQTVGIVKAYGDGVVEIEGLEDIKSGELVDLGRNQFGLALNLEKTKTGVVVLGDALHLKAGQVVKKTGRILSIGVSDDILGRTVDVLGRPLDGDNAITPEKYMLLEKKAPGIMPRQSVSEPMHTGLKAIDCLVPIGRGQRELIIGDRATGKTAVALGSILNQKGEDMICVYVCVGQKRSSLAQTIDILNKEKAMDYTVVVSATASVSAAEQFLAPYAGQAIAEYFLEKGKDVLIIFDDLTKHAQAYREISLLLKRPSGREAYPGDVFYIHSRLLERSCRLSKKNGGGSITALPIIETQDNDVSAFIPTNVISITDGQIYLESDLFNAGMKPAINIGLSVSRVGGAAQVKATKQVAGTMRLDLAQFRELQAFAQFSSDLDDKTKAQLDRGERVNSILKQGWDTPMKMEEQVVVVYAAVRGYLDQVMVDNIQKWEAGFVDYIKVSYDSILKDIVKEQKLTENTEKKLIEAIKSYNSSVPDLMEEKDV
jgi:F-type H+/Na+-transporting ATPase subunit alpha